MQSNVGMQLFSIHVPSEVNHTTDEIDVVTGDIAENKKGKRTTTMWGGDFNATRQWDQREDAEDGEQGSARRL